jgi:hypothetical protein
MTLIRRLETQIEDVMKLLIVPVGASIRRRTPAT